MKINRDICKRAKCKWFTRGERKGLALSIARALGIGYKVKETPKIPSTGLCSRVVWSMREGYFEDWLEVPPDCLYKAEQGVSQ